MSDANRTNDGPVMNLCDELRDVAAHSPGLYRTTDSRASIRSLLTEAADEIERLRKAGDELYLACIPAHDMLLDLGASTKVPVVAEQAGPIRRALDEAMQPWREAAIRE